MHVSSGLRVGLPLEVEDSLLSCFPSEVQIIRIDPAASGPVEIDFWIPPLYPKTMREVAARVRGVKVVQSLLAGVDVLLPLTPPGAIVCDGRGVHDVPVAEWIVGAILALLKYFPFYVRMQETGEWKRRLEAERIWLQAHPHRKAQFPPVLFEELGGKTVLIVGYGSIGEATEERLRPFDVRILRVARSARDGVDAVSRLDALLPEADIVVLLTPLTEETRGLIGRERLAAMRHGALLVNAARGAVVDTDALIEALRAGRLRAAVDVTDPEPLPDAHPLWSAPNLLITPHIAGASSHFMGRGIRLAAAQVRRMLAGEPLENVVRDAY
jgi:phosphoglycerate dehydrogenase-like enzyme